MSSDAVIEAPVSAETLSLIEGMAFARGITREAVAGELVRRAADDAASLTTDITEGRAEIAAGHCLEHDDFVAAVEAHRRQRRRAA